MALSWIVLLLTVGASIWIGYKLHFALKPPPIPTLEETWWGQGNPTKQDKSIKPFSINISEEALQDLRYRLDHTVNFVPPLEGTHHQYGFNANLLKEIIDFWKTKYDWRQREKYLNQFPQFTTNIQGLDIHYLHIKPKVNPSTRVLLPILLIHGWPDSFQEFHKLIPLLTTPQEGRNVAFEVIVPSVPGFGFSQAAARPGLGSAQIALVLKNFMSRLGFEKFYVQGGDFGAVIAHHLAVLFPDSVAGYHSNMCFVLTPLSLFKMILGSFYPRWIVKEEHEDRVYPLGENFFFRLLTETGHMHIQATKPDTLGVALRDSPAGLAAYILEKYVGGTDYSFINREDGGLKHNFKYEDLLDNVMIYWLTGSMPTSMRLYAETYNKEHMSLGIMTNPILVPTACARFGNDVYAPDGVLSELYPRLVHLSDYNGGHFAAAQLPEVLADDIFEAVEKF